MESCRCSPDFKGGFSGIGHENLVAQLSQNRLGERADAGLIFHQKDRLQSTGEPPAPRMRKLLRPRADAEREIDSELAALPWLAVDLDLAAGLGNNAIDRRETEPRSLAFVLRSEEGLEHARLDGFVHAHAVVAHFEQDLERRVARPFDRFGEKAALDFERSAERHRVPGVHREVHQNLLHLMSVGAYQAGLGAATHGQIDVLADHALQQAFDVPQKAAQIEYSGLNRLAAAEGEQLSGQSGSAPRRVQDLLQVTRSGGFGHGARGLRAQAVRNRRSR